MSLTCKFVFKAHHFTLLRLPLTLELIGRYGGVSMLCHSCRFAYHQRVLKTFPGPGYLHPEYGIVWLCHLLVNLYIWLTFSSCYGSIPLTLELIGRDVGLSTLCHSYGFACQQRVLKTFPGPGYLRPKYGIVWLCHLLVNLHIWLTISSCYGSIPLTLELIGRDVGLSTLCHSCGFACQQRVLKTFPGPGYLCPEYGVVWLCHLLVNLCIWLTISFCYSSIPLTLELIGRDGGLSTVIVVGLLVNRGC